MQEVTNISSATRQRMQIILDNGDTVDFRLRFCPRMEAWYFSFEYNELVCNDLKVCIHPNILRQFRRLIPFGIAFISEFQVEPFQTESFSSGACNMYILDKEEVQEIEEEFYN